MLELHLIAYLEQREAMERRLSAEAASPVVAEIHNILADCYAGVLRNGDASFDPRLFVAGHIARSEGRFAEMDKAIGQEEGHFQRA